MSKNCVFFCFFYIHLCLGTCGFRIYISQCHLCTEMCVYLYVVSDGFKMKYMYGMDGFSVALPSPRYLQMKITILFVYIFTNYTSYDDKLNSTSKMQFLIEISIEEMLSFRWVTMSGNLMKWYRILTKKIKRIDVKQNCLVLQVTKILYHIPLFQRNMVVVTYLWVCQCRLELDK